MKGVALAILVFCGSIQIGFAQTTKQDTLKELMRKVDILTQELEKEKLGEVSGPVYESKFGLGPAASKIYYAKQGGVSIAGYGEIVYNNFSDKTEQLHKEDCARALEFSGAGSGHGCMPY